MGIVARRDRSPSLFLWSRALLMPHGVVSDVMPAPSAAVFRLLPDYARRLEWDTLLREAYLTDAREAKLGAVSVCKGRAYLGGIALVTQYVSFRPPEVAAVKMINRPPFFETFAATIRHRDLEDGRSAIEYTFTFTARPRWLRFLLHPLMKLAFTVETKKRLRSLRRYLKQRP
jgi:hypothetical protein